MLAWIYPDAISQFHIPALNIAILGGSMIGQVGFGVYADVAGR